MFIAMGSTVKCPRCGCAVSVNGGRRIKVGLFPGLGDLVGWETVTITPEMAGQDIARILNIEIKWGKHKEEPHQVLARQIVNAAGGRAFVVRGYDGGYVVEGDDHEHTKT